MVTLKITLPVLLLVLLTVSFHGTHGGRISKPMHEPLSKEMIDFVNQLNTTWKAGHNRRFRTVGHAQVALGAIRNSRPKKLRTRHRRSADIELPSHFDAREKWSYCPSLSEIRDQSSCGSCWAFGAVEAMSDRICIASQGKYKPYLSAEDLLDCCEFCGDGCKGGFIDEAWMYWAVSGIVTGNLYHDRYGCKPYSMPPCEHHSVGQLAPCLNTTYPTPKCRRTCQKGYKVSYDGDKWFGKEVYTLNSNAMDIMHEVYTNGPVEVGFIVYADFLNYESGVYKHVAGKQVGGHAVRLLGWGEENGVPYWLLANSWNPDWGLGGYFKVLRGFNECGIESDVVTGLPRLPGDDE